MTTKRGDMTIAGVGKATGGLYERVTISGAGRVEGDVEAESLDISGAGKVAGAVKAHRVLLSGACKITGAVTAQEFHASGAWKVGGDLQGGRVGAAGAGKIEGAVRAQELSCSGTVSIVQGVHAQCVKLSGVFKVGGDVEAAEFRGSGAFKISGLLAADSVEIKLYERSWAREIGGAKIEVRKYGSFWGWLARLWGGQVELVTDLIEADEIYLEATTAKAVRGKKITLGPECQIERVEYSESLQIDPSSTVKELMRV